MKKVYVCPEFKMTEFLIEDIITVSGGGSGEEVKSYQLDLANESVWQKSVAVDIFDN